MMGPFDNEMDNLEWERAHMNIAERSHVEVAQAETKLREEHLAFNKSMCDCSPSHLCSKCDGKPPTMMEEAQALTHGDRRQAYGDPREVFDAYGLAWTAVLRQKLKPGETITGTEVTLMMAMLKICREAQQVKRDNVVDAHGYLALHGRVAGLEE